MEGSALRELFELIETLRGEKGCQWDREQKLEDVISSLIEEAYELEWANNTRAAREVNEELGDVLFLLCFATVLLRETQQEIGLETLARGAHDKIKRRHPHVFGGETAGSKEESLAHWNRIKDMERRMKETDRGILSEAWGNLPPVRRAEQMQRMAARVGFDWPDAFGILEKLREEIDELDRCMREGPSEAVAEEIGDLLFTVINLSRYLNVDSESALGRSTAKFLKRFQKMEELIKEEGKQIESLSITDLDGYWERAKKRC